MKNIPKYLRSTKGLFLIFGEKLKLRVRGYIDGRIFASVFILELCWIDMLEGFQATDQWKLNIL